MKRPEASFLPKGTQTDTFRDTGSSAEIEIVRPARVIATWKVFTLLASLLIAGAWGWVGYVSTRDYVRSIENGQRIAENLSVALAQQVGLRIELVDRVLIEAGNRLTEDPSFDLARWTLRNRSVTDHIAELLFIDAEGTSVRSSGGPKTRAPSEVELELFRRVRNDDDQHVAVGRRTADQMTGAASLRVGRRVAWSDRSLAGVMIAVVDPDSFLHYGGSLDVGSRGVVSIVSNDSQVAARWPPVRLPPGRFQETWSRTGTTHPSNRECLLGTSSLDTVKRIVCSHAVPGFRLTANVALDTDDALVEYGTTKRNYLMWALAFTAGALGFAIYLFFRERRMDEFAGKLERSEARAKEQKASLSTTLDSVAEGIALFDADDQLKVINRRGLEMLGLPREAELAHWPFREILEWQIAHCNLENFPPGTPVQTLLDARYEGIGLKHSLPAYNCWRKDGTVFEIRTYPADDGGTTRTYTDVTERVATARALEKAKEDAEAGNRAKTEFVATMSHEIRTPLNGVIGMANLLQESGLDDRQRHYAGTIRRCGDALLAIVEDILDFSKLEAGRFDLEHIPFETQEVARSVIDIMEGKAAEKDLRITYAEAPGFPARSCGDPIRLRQVLWNLVGNAIKFTDEGTITIDASVVVREGLRHLRYSVTDTGIGIPEEAHGRLFRQFEQTDPSVSRRVGGTGLGLAICRRIVEAFDGDLGFESRPGLGSTFWFEIPHEEPPAQEGELGATGQGLPPKLKVLVVEDNEINQEVVHALLTKLGHSVVLASSGQEAVERVRDGGYDLVLMDLNMPLMDGYETTAAIRGLSGPEANVTIVATTADASLEARERCLRIGMQAFVSKPFDIGRLEAALSGGAHTFEEPVFESRPIGPSLVDDARIRTLLSQLGPEVLLRLGAAFEEEAADYLEEMSKDTETAFRAVHNLKGSAANLGLVGAVDLCERTKEALESGTNTDGLVQDMLETVKRSVGLLTEASRAEAA